MKSFAFVLLCVIAAVQGRSTGVKVANQRAVAVASESPWVVHLRVATASSGHLQTCAGSLIGPSWVLTSARCVDDARFIWGRYGSPNVYRPELVLESSSVRTHQDWDSLRGAHNIGLVSFSREIEYTPTISAVALPTTESDVIDTANICAYGEIDHQTPGEELSCWDVEIIKVSGSDFYAESDKAISKFDSGAALVSDGVQVGVFDEANPEGSLAAFVRTSAYIDWIESETGLDFGGDESKPEAVIFVNN